MKAPRIKRTGRVGLAALALGVVAALVTALPAYAAVPAVTSVTPNTGAPGTAVVIAGSGFLVPSVTSVTIGGVSASFSISSAASITAIVPCGAAIGSVLVTNSDGTSPNTAADDFTPVAAGAPTVSSFTPTSGTAGSTSVVITGTNFCGATAVRFNTTTATVVSVNSATQITATVPVGATSGRISVTTPVNTGTSATNFTVGPPVITSFTPTIAPVGSAVTITGSNFTGITAVRFNGVSAVFTSTDTQISTTVPVGATTGPITVVNAVGTATGATFTVGVPSHDRSVSFGFEPNSRVSGQVNVSDNFAACYSYVPVVIQKQGNGGWKWVDTTSTTASGSFKTYIPPTSGTFRAKVNKLTLMNGATCLGDSSPSKNHNA